LKTYHWETLVEDPQFAIGGVGGLGVQEDAPVLDGTVDVGHHGADVPSSIRFRALLLALDVLQNGRLPLPLVALVQRVDLPPVGNSHIGISEDKLPDGGVQHEAIDPFIDGDDHHGGTAVQGVSGGDNLAAIL
jgi:hypothetical protein